MSITPDARTTGGSGTSVANLTWNHTVGSLASGILDVFSASADVANGKASTVVWDALGTPVSLTNLGQKNDTATQAWAEIWYLKNPASGTKQIKITFSGTLSVAQSGSASYDGVDQTTPWNAASPQSANGNTAAQPALTVTTAAGEWVVDSLTDNESVADTLVPGGGQNTIFNTTQSFNGAGGASDKAAAGSTLAMSWSGVGGVATWAYIAGSMRPAASTSGGGWIGSGTRRAPGQRGPFDQRGFLMKRKFDYTPAAAPVVTVLQRKTLGTTGNHTGGRQRRGQ